MAKVKTNVGLLREVIKEVIGTDRYSRLTVYVDKQKAGHRFKVQEVFEHLTEDEVRNITEGMREKHGIEVTVKSGRSGSRLLYWKAFFVPFE